MASNITVLTAAICDAKKDCNLRWARVPLVIYSRVKAKDCVETKQVARKHCGVQTPERGELVAPVRVCYVL